MNNKNVLETLKKLRQCSKKRNFRQTFDLILNLKDLDLKKPDHQLDFFVTLHYSKGREVKVCALVGPELQDEGRKVCDETITQDSFEKYHKDKKITKKLAETFDFFIAQANIMPKIASSFGTVFGPRGKMPNPKAGCIVPPKINLKPVYDKLQKTIRVKAKTVPLIQCAVGSEEMKDEEISDNIMTIYNQVIHHLPGEKNNIKSIYLKLTMGKPEKVE